MAKPKQKPKGHRVTSPAAVAMRLRYGQTTCVHKSRNMRRRNKDSWRRDEQAANGE